MKTIIAFVLVLCVSPALAQSSLTPVRWETQRAAETFCTSVAGETQWDACLQEQTAAIDTARTLTPRLNSVQRNDVVQYCIGAGYQAARAHKRVGDIGLDFGTDFREVVVCLDRAIANVAALPAEPYALHAYMTELQMRDGPVTGDL